MADADVKALVDRLAPPELDATTALTSAPPLHEATVAVVTTAGLSHRGEPWVERDTAFRVFGRDDRDLIVSHISTNFDRTGVAADLNVAYPLDRLEEMEADGVIGRLAPRHLSFMGALVELSAVILDSGPHAAKLLRDDGVDVVLLTPV